MHKLLLSATAFFVLASCAYATTVTYTLDQGGDGIELNQTGDFAAGYTFSKGCSNKMNVGGFQTSSKMGRKTWAISVPSGTTTGASAYFLDEKKLTWVLYYADSAYALPWSEVNGGTLSKTKTC